jgi:cell division protein FtsB
MARTEPARISRQSAAGRHRRQKGRAPSSLTRAERRAAIAHRRSVVALFSSVVIGAVILVAWFPAGALIDQRHTLSQASSTLTQLKQEDRALTAESKNLSTSSEIARIARQQFELVAPGEQAYQILPPAGTNGGATDPYSGDPGSAPPVSPSAAPELPPGALSSRQSAAAAKGAAKVAPASPDLLSRLIHTLEFWR